MKHSSQPPRIEVVCIGTELLTGKVNTHTAFLGQQLASIGFEIAREHTVGDDKKIMEETFREAYRRADIIFSCGGLGPTFDDITREMWAKVLKRPLKLQNDLVEEIQQKFASRGIKMPPHNRRQGYVLKGAKVIPNNNGTAPGQLLKAGRKILVLLPGPARELYPMVEETVLPVLKSEFPALVLIQKSFLSVGVPESRVDQLVRPFITRYKRLNGCTVTHGILASNSIITAKYSVQGTNLDKVREASLFLERKFRALLEPFVFGEDQDTLEGVVGNLLREQDRTLAVAESCTGGLLSKLLTDNAGSSDYFKQGVVTYTDESKTDRLGVEPATLRKYGAVSAQVAQEMAAGVKKTSGADYALSITGIAGPDGGSPEKPVGLVYIGWAGPKRKGVQEFKFSGERGWICHRSALMALDILRKELVKR